MRRLSLAVLALVMASLGVAVARGELQDVPSMPVMVINQFPHDPRAFTQGLAIADGQLYEGTGWLTESALRRVDLVTGAVLQEVKIPDKEFGEGIAVVGDRIVQLTWRTHVGYVYDRATFDVLGTFNYPTEGWGITYDGARLIMSDGSDTLRFWDPDTFAEIGSVRVTAGGQPVYMLNELELIDGLVYANVWQTDRIAIIDPSTGQVLAWLDLAGVHSQPRSSQDDVLNGIAFDADQRRLFITGKRWSALYELTVPTVPGR